MKLYTVMIITRTSEPNYATIDVVEFAKKKQIPIKHSIDAHIDLEHIYKSKRLAKKEAKRLNKYYQYTNTIAILYPFGRII